MRFDGISIRNQKENAMTYSHEDFICGEKYTIRQQWDGVEDFTFIKGIKFSYFSCKLYPDL